MVATKAGALILSWSQLVRSRLPPATADAVSQPVCVRCADTASSWVGCFLRDTHHVKIRDEVGGETANVRAAAAVP